MKCVTSSMPRTCCYGYGDEHAPQQRTATIEWLSTSPWQVLGFAPQQSSLGEKAFRRSSAESQPGPEPTKKHLDRPLSTNSRVTQPSINRTIAPGQVENLLARWCSACCDLKAFLFPDAEQPILCSMSPDG